MKPDTPQEAVSAPLPLHSAAPLRDAGSRGIGLPSQRELRAQIALLGDQSEAVFAAVRAKLLVGGARIERALQKATSSEDARLRMRARDLLASFKRDALMRRLIRTVSKPRFDLESALFRLANLAADDFDARPYHLALDAMAKKVRILASAESDPRTAVLALSRYLGEELGYCGAESDYHHPDNIHLFRVIERRVGMPLTLSALYLFVARRAGIRAGMIALPGHVLLRLYFGDDSSLIIDPFRGGIVRTRTDCIHYLRQCNLVPRPEWFQCASDETIFLRQLMNLVNSNFLRGHRARARQLKRIADLLAFVQGRRHPALRD